MSASEVKTRVVGQVAPTKLGLTLVVSLSGLSFALLQGWPLWAVGVRWCSPGYQCSPWTSRTSCAHINGSRCCSGIQRINGFGSRLS
jgi:hypothetical protein